MVLVPAVPAPPAGIGTSVLADLRGGLDYVLRHPRLRVLLPSFALANLFVLGLLGVAVPVLAKNVLHAGPAGTGRVEREFRYAAWWSAPCSAARFPERWQYSQRHIFLLFMASDLLLGAGRPDAGVVLACAVYLCSGLFAGPAATFYRTCCRPSRPAGYLGRVNSIAKATSFGLEPVSVTAVGALFGAGLSAAGRSCWWVGWRAASAVDFTGSALSGRARAAADAPAADANPAVTGP